MIAHPNILFIENAEIFHKWREYNCYGPAVAFITGTGQFKIYSSSPSDAVHHILRR